MYARCVCGFWLWQAHKILFVRLLSKVIEIRIRNEKKIKINNPSKYKYRIDDVPNIHIQQIDEIC